MVCLNKLADVSASDIKKINSLEKELGVVLMAYKPLEFAELSNGQVKELQKVEKDIGATVIAYR
ncbi:MAG TPA: hypothetical protein VGK23_06180 [Methanomassiliicoccales archaeon]|jgi:hypothetical protein